MIKKYLTILMTLVLISSLFIPGAMAQENENEFVKEIPLVANGNALAIEDKDQIENLVYYFLNAEGIEIVNLDLSQLKSVQSDGIFEFSGTISYDIVSEGTKSYTTQIYSSFDFLNSSVQLLSKSGNSYYEMYASLSDSESFTVKEISVVNGLVQKNINTIPISSQTEMIDISHPSEKMAATQAKWIKVDLPSMWSHVPILIKAYDDVQLSQLLTATGIAGSIAGYFSAGFGTVITMGSILAGQLWTANTKAQPDNTYVDIFKIPFGTILSHILPGILGTVSGSMYSEIDYYWVYM